jgi:hypothetical protein
LKISLRLCFTSLQFIVKDFIILFGCLRAAEHTLCWRKFVDAALVMFAELELFMRALVNDPPLNSSNFPLFLLFCFLMFT